MKRGTKGFMIVEIMIVVLVIGILASVATIWFIKAREVALRNLCINNLNQIQAAVDRYAMDTPGVRTGQSVPWRLLVPEHLNHIPTCSGREYPVPRVGSAPICPNPELRTRYGHYLYTPPLNVEEVEATAEPIDGNDG